MQAPDPENSGVTTRGGVDARRLAFPELGTGQVERLFSNIERGPLDVRFKRKSTSLLGATALVGGTTVGAGVLALPAATIQAGLVPSSLVLVGVWVYMVCTGLLIAEVNVNLICREGQPGLGLLALAERTLGKIGARAAGLLYVFIHYALLVAYMAQGGELLARFVLGGDPGDGAAWVGPVAFATLWGGGMALGSENLIEGVNNALVAVVLASFALLLVSAGGGIKHEYLAHSDWSTVLQAAPVMLVALVYHNVVPVITTQLEGDVNKIRTAIIAGSAVPLVMFLAWNVAVLGSVDPMSAQAGAAGSFDPVQALRGQGGEGDSLPQLVSAFSEAAIITSFIGFVVGLLDFFTDVFSIRAGDKKSEAPLYLLVLGPPLVVAITNPTIFYRALDTAGAFGISLLFGLLPAVMAWQQRYNEEDLVATLPLVPGGKASLLLIGGGALAVIAQNILLHWT